MVDVGKDFVRSGDFFTDNTSQVMVAPVRVLFCVPSSSRVHITQIFQLKWAASITSGGAVACAQPAKLSTVVKLRSCEAVEVQHDKAPVIMPTNCIYRRLPSATVDGIMYYNRYKVV